MYSTQITLIMNTDVDVKNIINKSNMHNYAGSVTHAK